MNTNRKVVLVGAGFVGMSMAYSLLNQGGVNELVLIDVLKDKAEGEAMDLNHGVPYASGKMDIKAGDYDECKNADIVVITAGLNQKPGQTRLELAETNAKIMISISSIKLNSTNITDRDGNTFLSGDTIKLRDDAEQTLMNSKINTAKASILQMRNELLLESQQIQNALVSDDLVTANEILQ